MSDGSTSRWRNGPPATSLAVCALLSLPTVHELVFIAAGCAPAKQSLFLAVGVAALGLLVARARGIRGALPEDRLLLWAAAAWVAAQVLSAGFSAAPSSSLAHAMRSVSLLGLALLVAATADARDQLRVYLAWTASALIVASLIEFAAGVISPVARSVFFEQLHHQHVGDIPRFSGTEKVPNLVGFSLLAWAGLAGAMPRERARTALRAIALMLAAATLSFASVLAVAVIAWRWLPRRWLRIGGFVAVVAAGVAALYVKPLTIRTASGEFTAGTLHPSYHHDHLGPVHMPRYTVAVAGVELDYHYNAYAYLAANAARCWWRHPVLGAGGRQVRTECPTVVLNTAGYWGNPEPHNGYLRVLAESGALGALAGLALLIGFGRAVRWPRDRLASAILLALFISGLATDEWLRAPLAIWLGTLRTVPRKFR